MGLYEPKSFCICFDTKNGSLILALLSLIGAIMAILSAVGGPLANYLDILLEPDVQEYELDPEDRHHIIMYWCIGAAAYNTIIAVCSSLLIHGIRTDLPVLMMPYLVLQRIRIILYIIGFLLGTALAIYALEAVLFIYIALPLTIVATIDIYFHLVINAYHKQVKLSVCGGTVYYREFHNGGNDYKGKV